MQYHHNHPHSDLREYFDAIFATDHPEYKGMVTVAARDSDGVLKTVAIVPADQMGVWASKMHISHRMDYYYSKSQHCGKATWGMDRAFAFNAIFVDIDAHGCAQASAKNLIDTICYALPDIGIPCPNIIENSGRGYHLIWLIEQVAVSLDWIRKAASALKAAFQNLKQYILCLYVRPCRPSSKYKVELPTTLRHYNRGSVYNRKSVLLWLL